MPGGVSACLAAGNDYIAERYPSVFKEYTAAFCTKFASGTVARIAVFKCKFFEREHFVT